MRSHQTEQAEVPIDRIRQPLQHIIHLENLSGLALIAGAVTALILANTAFAESVAALFDTGHEAVGGWFGLAP